MIWAAAAFAALAAAHKSTSALQTGKEEFRLHVFNSNQAELEADAVREAAAVGAFKTKKAGAHVASGARAAFGASGVAVDRGTAATVQDSITAAAGADALEQILYGERRALHLERDAALQRQAAETAVKAGSRNSIGAMLGGFASAGSLLSSGSQPANGWK